MTEKEKATRPIHSIKFGKIQANIWQNDTKHGVRFNVTVCRLYLDDGKWKRSDSFNATEILVLSKALTEAHTWIYWNLGKVAGVEAEATDS